MNVLYEESFGKDLKKIKNLQMKLRLKKVIEGIKSAHQTSEIRNIKKLQNSSSYYRIRIGDYRVGLEISNDTVTLIRILHRKDVYKYFP